MIAFDLEEDQRLIRDTVHEFAQEKIRPRLREFERAGDLTDDFRRAFDELGLSLLDAPESLGGAGQPALTNVVAQEELAWGDPGVAVALFRTQPLSAALLELASTKQQQRFFVQLAKPVTFGSVAFSEPGPVQGQLFATRARRDGDSYRLTGEKRGVLFGDRSDLTLVFATVDGEPDGWPGAGAFLVEGRLAGQRNRMLGLNATPICDLKLQDVRVPEENRLLGGADFHAAFLRFTARYALLTAARQVGLARAAFEMARQYSEERHAFGKPIAHFQEIAFFLADMHMEVEASRYLVWRAARALDLNAADWQVWVAKAAAHVSEAAWMIADRAVQILGGAGYMRDHPAEKWLRDTKTLALIGVPFEVNLETIAHAELGEAPPTGVHPRLQAPIT